MRKIHLAFLSLFAVLALILNADSHAQNSCVIESFEAGPEKVQKKVSGVKTRFSGGSGGQCNCPQTNEGPCIQTFLDKKIDESENYPSMIEDYYIQNNMGSEYKGAGNVPWGIDFSSVRLFNFPFCKQLQRPANPDAKSK